MKVLVTVDNGYLCTWIVKQLCDDGVEAIATDFKTDLIDDRATKIEEIIFDLDNPFEELGEPDVLLHMAWRNGFVHNDPSHINDLPNHYSFIKKMFDGGCKQIAVMGTMHEVGFFEGSIKEDVPTHPESLYGIAKDALRNTTKLLCKNTGATFQWLTGYYIVGNSEHGCSIFRKITAAEKQGQDLFPLLWVSIGGISLIMKISQSRLLLQLSRKGKWCY